MEKSPITNSPRLKSDFEAFQQVDSLYAKGLWKFKMGEYQESLEFMVKTIDELKNISEEKKNFVLTKCWKIIGDIYLKMSEYDKAFEYFTRSLEMKKVLNKDTCMDLAEIYDSLSNYYDLMNNFQRSYEFKRLVYKIRLELLGEKNHYTANSINSLAISLIKLKNSKEAENFFLKSCKIREELSKKKPNRELADSYYNLAVFYEKTEQYEKCLDYFLKAYEIRKKLEKNNQDLLESLLSLSHVYKLLNDKAKEKKYNELAVEMNKKIDEENHLKEADLLYKLALSYQSYGEEKRASETFLQYYHILKKKFPNKHELIKKIVENIGKTNQFSEHSYLNWNYIQLFKWIDINKINPKIMEVLFPERFDGGILKELIFLANNNKDELILKIEKHSNNDISKNDIQHLFSCLDAL